MEETLDLRDVLETLRRKMRFIVGIFVLGMLAAVIFLLLVTPKYTADATLIFNPGQFEISKEKSQLGPQLFDRLITGEIASIKSPAVLSKTISTENLLYDQELNKSYLRSLLDDVIALFQSGPAATNTHKLQVIERFKKLLEIDHPERTNLITISYTSKDPVKAARVANSVTNIFLEQQLVDRVASTPLAAKWLQDQKVVLREKWRVSRAQVEKFKADHGLSYLSGEKLRDLQVDRLNEQKVLAGTKTEETRARVEQVRRMLKSRDYQQLANTNNSEVLTKLRDRLAAASQREASLNTTLLPNHPSLRKARAEIASLRKQIENEGRRVLDDLEVKFRSAQEREQLIGQNFDKTISDMQESGTSIVKLRELERTAASDRKIYESFLNRSNETIEQSTGSFANFRLIKSAQVPIKPSFPGKLKVLVLAAMGSLALGIGLSLVQEALNSTFRPQDQISDSLGLPLLASLPTRLNGDAAQGLPSESFISRESGTPLANAVKRLLRAMGPAGGAALPTGMIAVTSTGEGEGKTMTAVSLAQMAALSGSKVLLIDGDIRNPSLDRIFSHESWNCIARDHHDSVGSNPMLFEDRSTGLHILPAFGGQARGNGSVDSHEFKEMLLTAREEYELVIVDTAGVLTNPDSWDLADAADQVIFVIASNKTQHESASRALEMLKTCHARMAGVVLNFADNEQMAERKGNAPAFSSAARHGIHGFALRAGRAETGQQRPYPLG